MLRIERSMVCMLAIATIYAPFLAFGQEYEPERHIYAGNVWSRAKVEYKKLSPSLRRPDADLARVMEKETSVIAIYVELKRDKAQKVESFRLFYCTYNMPKAVEVRPGRAWKEADEEFSSVLRFLGLSKENARN